MAGLSRTADEPGSHMRSRLHPTAPAYATITPAEVRMMDADRFGQDAGGVVVVGT